ncbi:unnamed protein product [Zymoseptoria tritici ST99CH_1A5]|uniref:AHC1-like C2H2 zinc-finger domain-containing protein n=1 Tax=Zymoseptoria tritici ST99CH_1A5 TaxID=1276529 RepID=A0A1Y6M1M7_ZYMTR|nr:unnamed protein product [Zymoseptoria tritici ST99CH_1A5]
MLSSNMQSVFRLPWSNDALKLGEKSGCDKMRSNPIMSMPMLKRKRSDSVDPLSPYTSQQVKKARPDGNVNVGQVLNSPAPAPAPLPVASERKVEQSSVLPPSWSAQPASPVSPIVNAPTQPAQATGGAAQTDINIKQTSDKPLSRFGQDYALKPMPELSPPVMAADNASTPDITNSLTPLQQVIENELNMQILMKHNELRLVEQELAKCQVALEQLRRCELRPYPGAHRPSLTVTTGMGPSVAPPLGHSRPPYPAPHGVVDGPYSHHYRKWLLRDPLFDAMSPAQISAQAETMAAPAARPGRPSGHQSRKSTSKPYASTRSESLHSIPNYPSAAGKDKSTPMVLRRSTDGQLVKLICKNCHRGNFSSIQGFLNHCRIAHKVDYKSHDQAAVDCGQLLDQTEVANLPLETQTAPVPKPPSTRNSVSHAVPPVRAVSSFVHPLNTGNTPVATPRAAPRPKQVSAPSLVTQAPQKTNPTPFKPSTDVPRLSAHFAKHNFGGNLEKLTADAKQKVDLTMEDDIQSPDTPEFNSFTFPGPGRTMAPASRPSTEDSNDPTRPPSRKGHHQILQRPRPSPLAPHSPTDFLSSPQEPGSASLSPHAADSNPGLISDDEDDHNSGSDEEAPHPSIVAPHRHPAQVEVGGAENRFCSDNSMEIDVEEGDEIDQHGVIIRRNSMGAAEARGGREEKK